MTRCLAEWLSWLGFAAVGLSWLTLGHGNDLWLLPALLTLTYPIFRFFGPDRRRVIELRRYRAGQCVGCGYDLRESPIRCPECGQDVQVSIERVLSTIQSDAKRPIR